jgi:outer membrane murein-binding lipoprotein Lpp
MKKVIFTIGIIAILVGVSFAGIAGCSSQPSVSSETMMKAVNQIDTKVTGLQGSVAALDKNVTTLKGSVGELDKNVTTLAQGNTTMMQTISGIVEGALPPSKKIIERSYDGIRHFHVSCAKYLDDPVEVVGWIQRGDGSWEVVHDNYIESGTVVNFTDEFDASKISITVMNRTSTSGRVVYAITMTYPIKP